MTSANRDAFLDYWEAQHRADRLVHPHLYIGDADTTVTRMRRAIIEGTFSKESRAMVYTCKHFGIKHTYKAIKEFIATP